MDIPPYDNSKRTREYDDKQRAIFKPKSTVNLRAMPSSKGEPTDPELREKIKEEVKNEEKGKFHSCTVENADICRSYLCRVSLLTLK